MRLNARTSFARTVALGCLLSPIALSASAVETKPAAPPAAAKPTPAQAAEARRLSAKAMSTALANLAKEYQAYATDKTKATKLRDKSDYFVENKTSDLTDAQLLQAMNSPIAQDAAADAYIKWQLMSGLSAQLDDKATEPLYMAYTKGPALPHRPGMSAEEKKELDKLVYGIKDTSADTINAINEKLKVPVDAWLVKIAPIIAYRDALHKKLPQNTVFQHSARLTDVVSRWTAGVEVEKLSETWRLETKAWVKGNPAPREAAFLADQVLKFIDDWGGIPKKPAASVGPSNEIFASPLGGDDASAPVILAAGKMNYPNGANPNYPGYPGQGMKKEFPPKYYEQVEFDTKINGLKWNDTAGKFVKKDLIVELYQDLRDAGKASPATPNMKGDTTMKGDPNMKGGK